MHAAKNHHEIFNMSVNACVIILSRIVFSYRYEIIHKLTLIKEGYCSKKLALERVWNA